MSDFAGLHSTPDDERSAALVTALGAVRARIAAACTDAARDPGEVTLIAVTKTRPVSDVVAVARVGVLDLGESKDQEARAKIAELTEPTVRGSEAEGVAGAVRWHLVGRLQTNKARSVASYAHAVHSVDRLKLVRALAEASQDRATPLDVFVQVSLDDDPDRGGSPASQVPALADAVAGHAMLRLRGLMAVPPMDSNADAAYVRLGDIAARLRQSHPQADAISAGMSDDLEVAVRHGATHVRVGTALLGRRPPLFS